jgi:hypothetical protein
MATYNEIFSIPGNSQSLREKITVAIAVKAYAIASEPTPTAGELAWAKDALQRPQSWVDTVLYAALAANKDSTVAQIQNANDAGVQTVVNNVVDNLLSK